MLVYLEVDGLDDTDSDGLTHVTYGKATQWREVRERLDAEGLGGHQGDHGGISGLDELGVLFGSLAGTTIAFLLDLGELAGDVGSVAIQHGGVTVANLAGVVQHDDLGEEVSSTLGWVVLGVTGNVATTQFLDGHVLDVETDVVTWSENLNLRNAQEMRRQQLNYQGRLLRGLRGAFRRT